MRRGEGWGKEFGWEDGGVSTIVPLLPPTVGKNMPEAASDCDSAAPTAVTVVKVYKISKSHLHAIGIAGIAIALVLRLAPDNRCCYR